MAHPLAKYLEEKNLSHEAFAKLAGIERATISKVLAGKRKRFSPEAAEKIAKATNGTVTINDALGIGGKDRSGKAA